MAAVKSRGNATTEKAVAAIFRSNSISGWRRNVRSLPGTPDFAFGREKVAVFVDGCFWHGCPRCYREPKSNVEFWRSKIGSNVARDARVRRRLNRIGWSCVRIREHEIRLSPQSVAAKVKRATGL